MLGQLDIIPILLVGVWTGYDDNKLLQTGVSKYSKYMGRYMKDI